MSNDVLMGPPMHSPLSSSEDDLNISQNDDNIGADNDGDNDYAVQSGHRHRRHHTSRRHKDHKERKHRRRKHKTHSSQPENPSRRRKHRPHHYGNEYDFEPKPQIMSSKPLVQYDDVSENDDIISESINEVFTHFLPFISTHICFLSNEG